MGITTGILFLIAAYVVPNYKQFRSMPSPFEMPENLEIVNWSDLANNVAFLPQRGWQFLIVNYGSASTAWIRSVSVVLAVVTLIVFFYILRHWYTSRVAVLGTFLFGASSWFLHQARSAEPDVLYMLAATALLLCTAWLSEKSYTKALPILALIAGLLFYIPGMWLFVFVGIVLARQEVLAKWHQASKKLRITSILLFLLAMLPMVYGFIRNPSQIITALGVPADGVLNAKIVADNIINIPGLFINGLDEPFKWLTNTPILDVFSLFMVIIGIYAYRVGHHPVRGRALAVMAILTVVLISLDGAAALGLLMPIIYLLAASGIGLMLQQWFAIFPRNPLARNIGVAWLCLALVVVGYYHLNRYFVAWPHAATTAQVINLEQ